MYDVIVIGVGGMGSAAACHLARRGARVLALEQFDIPHDLGSSHGISRIIRLAYWEHPDYVPLVRRAYELWRELEVAAGERLLVVTGSIDAGDPTSPNIVGVRDACQRFELAHEELDSAALTAKFPGYRLPRPVVAILQPDGGFLLPERCVVAHVEAAQRAGPDVRGREPVLGWDVQPDGVRVRTNRQTHAGARLVVTAGAWTTSIATHTLGLLTPERQVMLWSQPRVPEYFQVGKFPVFYIRVAEGGFYGFPIHGVPGMKIGKYHHRGGNVDPDTMDRQAHLDEGEEVVESTLRYFPLSGGPPIGINTGPFTKPDHEDLHYQIL